MRSIRRRILVACCARDQAQACAFRAAYGLTARGLKGKPRSIRVDRAIEAAGQLAIADRRLRQIEASLSGISLNQRTARWNAVLAEVRS